ncbi:MAG TPA: type II toxin-antitoxin system Phd/YefM family antitoxin [Nitrospiraceae bacterium]|nr:type II toxin-antitoxin system Phd/YefM family antitoxin [Nitrospiraceae bacterium]
MAITSKDIISLSHARAKLTELCEEVRTKGSEKIITKNGGSCAALIDAERLDYYHRLEREHIQVGLLQEAIKGMTDLKAKKKLTLAQLKSRHGR